MFPTNFPSHGTPNALADVTDDGPVGPDSNNRTSATMKYNNYRNRFLTPLLALALPTGLATAGTTETVMPTPAPAPQSDVISGTLSLDFNTHFVSYGFDVWQDGTTLSNPEFNPSLNLDFALPNDLTFNIGTWMDFVPSNKGGDSPIGGRLQEVDVWTGLSYTYEKFTMGATYQAWMYGSDTEDILDIAFSYDCFLSPSLTVHNRLDEGASGGNTGTVLVLGLGYDFELGPVSLGIPVNIAYFCSDDFHPNSTDSGFGYASIGLTASLPLTPYIGDSYGEWDIHTGMIYYFTSDDVVGNSQNNNFPTVNLGLGVSF